jgi:positive regulator of sigma E activity
LRSSFIVYGLPVLMIVAGMFAGAALGHRFIDDGDLASGIGGLAGFGISLALSSLYSRRLSVSSSCEPEILSIRHLEQH